MREAVIVLAHHDIASKRKYLNDASADRVVAVSDLTADANDAKHTVT